MVSGPRLVEEMCRAPENVLSLIEASKDVRPEISALRRALTLT